MSGCGRLETWTEKWAAGRTGWHKTEVNFALRHHGPILLPVPQRRVFVPLCGKSVDLKWFYDAGHYVVGVEGVEQPVTEFFTEFGIKHTIEQLSWGKVYKSHDDRLHVYCCDLFSVDKNVIGKFDAVWDRGSLVAIYEEDRERYSQLLKSLLAPDFRYLVNLMQYTPSEVFNGPPRNVPTELVEKLYGDVSKVQVLETIRWTQEDGPWFDLGMCEVVVLLTPRYPPS